MDRAERKLNASPVEIPHREHRELHLALFSRLPNLFVKGLLQAYWDTYEAVGLHRYFEYSYYERIWASHKKMVAAVEAGALDKAKEALAEHFILLGNRLHGGLK